LSFKHKGLGEWPSWDGRDSLHLMTPILAASTSGTALPEEKMWRVGRISDQGREGACCGHGWTGWLNCEPVKPKVSTQERFYNDQYAYELYRAAQKVDQWPGENYEGTSSRATANVMRSRGFLDTYIHAATYADIRAWLLAHGPVVLSTRWDEASYEPDNKGFLRHGGRVVGGHCFLAYGISEYGSIRCANSWGADWGQEGSFWISKREWLYRVNMGYSSAISSEQLAWRVRRERRGD
jgi:hypothetical protein